MNSIKNPFVYWYFKDVSGNQNYKTEWIGQEYPLEKKSATHEGIKIRSLFRLQVKNNVNPKQYLFISILYII